MARSFNERLRELVVNLVGVEAMRIKCDRKVSKHRGREIESLTEDAPNKIKRNICELFRGDYDEGVVRRDMLDYLDWQTGFVDKDSNPSYHMLKEMIERGDYDFDFGKYSEERD